MTFEYFIIEHPSKGVLIEVDEKGEARFESGGSGAHKRFSSAVTARVGIEFYVADEDQAVCCIRRKEVGGDSR